jgi:DNA primase
MKKRQVLWFLRVNKSGKISPLGKGGSAITFLMEIENFTYPEALRHAAKKYGIEIEEDK